MINREELKLNKETVIKDLIKHLKLDLETATPYLEKEWEESEKLYLQGNLFFLQKSYIREQAIFVGINEDDIDECINVAAKFIENPALLRFACHEFYLINVSPNKNELSLNKRPYLDSLLGSMIYTYNLLLIMASIPSLQTLHKSLSIPNNISDQTIQDISFLVAYFKKERNVTGLGVGEFNWRLSNSFKAKEFTIGRLRYELCNANLNASVYKNTKTGEHITLANSGLNIDRDGLMLSEASEDTWETTVTERNHLITAHTCSSDSRVEKETETINVRKWEKVFASGDHCLGIHISAGPDFTLEACSESLKQVEDFMKKCFPEHKYKGFTCHTWFFDINFQTLLPANNKILQFQQQFILAPSQGLEQLQWVFGIGCNREDLPKNTSMQTSLAEFIENGGHLRTGAGFILKENIHKWGSQT